MTTPYPELEKMEHGVGHGRRRSCVSPNRLVDVGQTLVDVPHQSDGEIQFLVYKRVHRLPAVAVGRRRDAFAHRQFR